MSEAREHRLEELERGRLARALAAPLRELADRGWRSRFLRGRDLGLSRTTAITTTKHGAGAPRMRAASDVTASEHAAKSMVARRTSPPRIGIEGGAVVRALAAAPRSGAAASGRDEDELRRVARASGKASTGGAARLGGVGVRLARALQSGRVVEAGVARGGAVEARRADGAAASHRGRDGRPGGAGATGERGAPGEIGVRLAARGRSGAARRDAAVRDEPTARASRPLWAARGASPVRLAGLGRVEELLARLRSGEDKKPGESSGGKSGAVRPERGRGQGHSEGGGRERGSAGQAIVVNYTPSVTVEGRGEQGLERRLLEVLERHGYELAEVLRREAAKRRRGEF